MCQFYKEKINADHCIELCRGFFHRARKKSLRGLRYVFLFSIIILHQNSSSKNYCSIMKRGNVFLILIYEMLSISRPQWNKFNGRISFQFLSYLHGVFLLCFQQESLIVVRVDCLLRTHQYIFISNALPWQGRSVDYLIIFYTKDDRNESFD